MIRQGKTARPALKICGVTNALDLAYCLSLGVDYVGLNLSPRSKRHVTAGEAARIVAAASFPAASRTTRLVAVLVDPSDDEVDQAVQALPMLAALQFHGDEAPEVVLRHVQRVGRPAWKALGVRTADDVRRAAAYEGIADLVLYDAAPFGGDHGGTGRSFDWAWLGGRPVGVPFGVAGGVRPGMLDQLKALLPLGPSLIDVCSGVETSPRVKDHGAVAAMYRDALSLGEAEA